VGGKDMMTLQQMGERSSALEEKLASQRQLLEGLRADLTLELGQREKAGALAERQGAELTTMQVVLGRCPWVLAASERALPRASLARARTLS
jgi:uncharacterized coiled-coil protein SlyX